MGDIELNNLQSIFTRFYIAEYGNEVKKKGEKKWTNTREEEEKKFRGDPREWISTKRSLKGISHVMEKIPFELLRPYPRSRESNLISNDATRITLSIQPL